MIWCKRKILLDADKPTDKSSEWITVSTSSSVQSKPNVARRVAIYCRPRLCCISVYLLFSCLIDVCSLPWEYLSHTAYGADWLPRTLPMTMWPLIISIFASPIPILNNYRFKQTHVSISWSLLSSIVSSSHLTSSFHVYTKQQLYTPTDNLCGCK